MPTAKRQHTDPKKRKPRTKIGPGERAEIDRVVTSGPGFDQVISVRTIEEPKMQIPEKWTFENENVADNFDQHVREQLPWYDMVTRAVVHYAEHYVQPNTFVIDVGASTGNIGRAIQSILDRREATLVPVEPAQEMVDRYLGPGRHSLIRKPIEQVDIGALPKVSLFVSMLSFMFVPPRHRRRVLSDMIDALIPGGAIIIVDKVTNAGGEFGSATMRLTLREKKQAGAPLDQIAAKELSLAGVQRPLVTGWLENTFQAKKWFQFGDFAGWVIEKDVAQHGVF